MFYIIITSVINFKEKELSYSKTRSCFDPAERAEQTKKTIESLRNKIPGARVFLVEQGTGEDDLTDTLKNLVDGYLYIGNKKVVRWATDSRFKGLGEAVGLLSASKVIKFENDSLIFKISGRYYLNDDFNLEDWISTDGFIGKVEKRSISTRLYAFKSRYFKAWRRCLFLSLPLLYLNRSLETLFYIFIPSKIVKNLDILGVSGFVAVDSTKKEFKE